jgi:formate dehydrogenase beta subunit
MEISRRSFLKASGGLASLAVCQPLVAKTAQAAADAENASHKAMLIDVTKCVGCWYCYAACKKQNGYPETNRPTPDDPPELAHNVWTTLHISEKDGVRRFRKQACMHCTNAACVEVCPTGALSYNEMGFVQYDKEKCSGCGYCTQYCPFEVPQLEANPTDQMDKCTFCFSRVTSGGQTACSAACPTGAIKFGNRGELLDEGKARVVELQKQNAKASLYGDSDVLGGLHVMYVLDDTAESYGLPADPSLPAPAAVHEVIQWVGIGAFFAVVGGFSLNYLVARARIAREEKK